MIICENAVGPFDFRAVALAHGWVALAPFAWDEQRETVSYTLRLPSTHVVLLSMSAADQGVAAKVATSRQLSNEETESVRAAVRRMWRLDEDLSDFHRLRVENADWPLELAEGGGRIMRAPRLFDDIVYTICTTNVRWSGTKRMVSRLVDGLGSQHPLDASIRAFPTPEQIANAGADYLREQAGLGYRSAYVWKLATDCASGELDLAWFEDSNRQAEEVSARLKELQGVGPYAAATLMTLLGFYEHIAIDSVTRSVVGRIHFNGDTPSDSQIRDTYERWGRWKQLAYWFDAPGS